MIPATPATIRDTPVMVSAWVMTPMLANSDVLRAALLTVPIAVMTLESTRYVMIRSTEPINRAENVIYHTIATCLYSHN